MAVLVFLYEPDLFFSSRIESGGARFGLEVETMVTLNALEAALRGGLPKLLLVNLDVLEERHESLTGLVAPGGCRLVGYYSHVDAKSAEQALRTGFDVVIPRRAIAVKLNEIFSELGSG